MRDNLLNSTQMETLPFHALQTSQDTFGGKRKPAFISVSSNVYYGYQPLIEPQNDQIEPMSIEETNKSLDQMDTSQYTSRKRVRCLETCALAHSKEKRRRHDEPPKSLQSKINLDEELLRETHGCSYYHWISSSP